MINDKKSNVLLWKHIIGKSILSAGSEKALEMLNSKLRHIKIFKFICKHQLQLGSNKPEVVRSILSTGGRGKVFINKI